jgi:hypothetical protein
VAGRGGRSSLVPFSRRGKARLVPVGREVVFGSGTYTHGSPRPTGLPRWTCTAASPSGSKARKRRRGDWAFLVSRVGPYPYPVHRRPGPQDPRPRSFLAYAPQKGVVRQGAVWVPRNVDGLDRERVEQVEKAADAVRVRVANGECR